MHCFPYEETGPRLAQGHRTGLAVHPGLLIVQKNETEMGDGPRKGCLDLPSSPEAFPDCSGLL